MPTESKITEMVHRMECIKKEMEELKRLEKEKQVREIERSSSMDPNMEYMKEWLERSSLLKEYYELDDTEKHTHWLALHRNHTEQFSTHPKMIEYHTRTSLRAQELSKIIQQQYQLLQSRRDRSGGDTMISERTELKRIQQERNSIQQDIEKDIENNKQYWEISRKPHRLLSGHNGQLSDLPTSHTIQLIESTYNMFNIITTQIQKINQRLDKIETH